VKQQLEMTANQQKTDELMRVANAIEEAVEVEQEELVVVDDAQVAGDIYVERGLK
jgi:hypothetical protein